MIKNPLQGMYKFESQEIKKQWMAWGEEMEESFTWREESEMFPRWWPQEIKQDINTWTRGRDVGVLTQEKWERIQEKAKEVQSRIEPINKELQGIRNKVAEAEHALRTQSLSSTSRMGKVKDIQEWRRQEKILKDQIKDLEYEKNYGRPPETPLEIVENARKSIDKLTKAIEEGNEEEIQLSEKALQKNKQV